MAYEEVPEKFILDILKREEFTRNTARQKDSTGVDFDIKLNNKLLLRSYQKFAEVYCSPNSPTRRLYIKYGTGVGKTILACNVARKMIDNFNKQKQVDPQAKLPVIAIIGFTQTIFKRELLRWPEFGYVNRNELARLKQLAFTAETGTSVDQNNYNEFLSMLRRRLTNKRKEGYFVFYGYREFANRAFISDEDINNLDEDEIHKRISNGKIKLNLELFESMRYGQVICDEIHNVYNSCDKNNWGIALQALFNYLKNDIRVLLLSATPINHSPREIIDLLNLLSDKEYKKQDFFSCNAESVCITGKTKNVISDIGKLFIGKVLFLEDADPRYYPRSELQGEKIPGIDILKFVRSEMCPLGLQTYKEIYTGTLSQESQYIMDFILPSPESDKVGLYKTQDVKTAYLNADQEWLEKNDIVITNENDGMIISGQFLHIRNLHNVSTKYTKMLKDIFTHLRNGGGKIMIYHKYVRMSGVLFIKEILSQNGIIDEFSEPADNTLDANTGLTKLEHEKAGIPFTACRFVLYHSDIDQFVRNRSIEKYNMPSNARGDQFKILLGADSIKESHDIKCISLLMVMSKPDNISTLLQIFGRANRQNSHADLPPESRMVVYRIYTTKIPENLFGKQKFKNESAKDDPYYGLDHLSYEEKKYGERVIDYKVIQQIERAINENAADAQINFDMIKSTFVSEGQLGVLPFTPKFGYSNNPITWTSDAYYVENNIADAIYIIKRLFIEVSSVLNLEDIVRLVQDPPFSTEFNTKLVDRETINIALYRLTVPIYGNINTNNNLPIDKLFDANERSITKDGVINCITKIDNYYILSPISNSRVNIFVESPYRSNNRIGLTTIDITSYVRGSDNIESYELRKENFIRKYKSVELDHKDFMIAHCEFTVEFHKMFIEEIIAEVFLLTTEKAKTKLKPDVLEFYVKMLIYYDIYKIIINYDYARDYIQKTYSFSCDTCSNKSYVVNNLEAQLSNFKQNANMSWLPKMIEYNSHKRIKQVLENIKTGKIDGTLLPIGYAFNQVPRFFHPVSGWIDAVDYSRDCITYKENDVIIGFISKSETGFNSIFKIRSPLHKQSAENKSADSRLIERGVNCAYKSKTELINTLKKLGIDNTDNIKSANELCETMHARLIYLELVERSNPTSNIKYFYNFWECQPI